MNFRGHKRVASLILVSAVAGVSPLIALPAVTASYGATAWASIAIAQAVGSAFGVIAELGWGVNGPQAVARSGAASARRTFGLAVITRALVALPLMLVAGALALIVVVDHQGTAFLCASASVAAGLSSTWFFVGRGRPHVLLATDALPRLVLVSLSAIWIRDGGGLASYGAALLLSSLVSPLLGAALVRADFRFVLSMGRRRVITVLLAQSVPTRGRVAGAIYLAFPTILLGVVAPGAVAAFAATDRLQRIVHTILQSVPSALQSWVGLPVGRSDRIQRSRRAILICLCMGVAAGVAFALLAPWVSGVLFSDSVHLSYPLTAVAGLVIALSCVSRGVGGIGLVVLRRLGDLSRSATVGLIAGVPAILLLGSAGGALGAMCGELVAEASALVVQIRAYRRGSRDEATLAPGLLERSESSRL
ncbi:lipopolysaccharide biosynthesis protein [Cellulomonas sp. P5_C5]